ncbi:MAG: choice-of-anchor J domain-containing protein, partial [Paludibacteraceae bacterium]|nr:choice-of-anchor J domain-containing protein [Paludibacteraceae bacterium]
MRKFTYFYSLLLTALFLLPWSGVKATTPFTEGFEGSFVPTGWSTIHVSGTPNWQRSSNDTYVTPHGGSYYAKKAYNNSTNENYLITPQLSPVAGETLQFYIASQNYTGSTVTVEVSETTATADAFTTVLDTYKSYVEINNSWGAAKEISLSSYAGKNIYIAFHVVDKNGGHIYLDD